MSTPTYRSQTPQSQHLMSTPRNNRNNYSSVGFSPGQPPSSSQGEGSASGTNAVSSRSVNPFVSNPHGHPSFNPVKIGTKGAGDSKNPKQPKAPDKPLMPYMRYSRKVWDSVKASNPDLKLWEIGKVIGQMWRELNDDEKQEYLDEYETEKILYTEAMKAYHNSPAYQSWLSAKGKVDLDPETEEPEKTRRTKTTGSTSAAHTTESRAVTLQQQEEDDDPEDGYSIKHVAAARYQRNHCLINEIFSDAVVPDVRTIINEGRMMVLKRQVNSLSMHQKKLESELEQIEQKHVTKKCKFAESSEKFYDDLSKLCYAKPQITDEQFNLMIVKAKEDLREKQKLVQIEQHRQQKLDISTKKEVDLVKAGVGELPVATVVVEESSNQTEIEIDCCQSGRADNCDVLLMEQGGEGVNLPASNASADKHIKAASIVVPVDVPMELNRTETDESDSVAPEECGKLNLEPSSPASETARVGEAAKMNEDLNVLSVHSLTVNTAAEINKNNKEEEQMEVLTENDTMEATSEAAPSVAEKCFEEEPMLVDNTPEPVSGESNTAPEEGVATDNTSEPVVIVGAAAVSDTESSDKQDTMSVTTVEKEKSLADDVRKETSSTEVVLTSEQSDGNTLVEISAQHTAQQQENLNAPVGENICNANAADVSCTTQSEKEVTEASVDAVVDSTKNQVEDTAVRMSPTGAEPVEQVPPPTTNDVKNPSESAVNSSVN